MITLYKDGDSHTVRGVKCQLKQFEVGQLKSAILNGWRITPEKLVVDTNQSGKLSAKEVREAAKKAGIEDWKKGKIADLKKALDV